MNEIFKNENISYSKKNPTKILIFICGILLLSNSYFVFKNFLSEPKKNIELIQETEVIEEPKLYNFEEDNLNVLDFLKKSTGVVPPIA